MQGYNTLQVDGIGLIFARTIISTSRAHTPVSKRSVTRTMRHLFHMRRSAEKSEQDDKIGQPRLIQCLCFLTWFTDFQDEHMKWWTVVYDSVNIASHPVGMAYAPMFCMRRLHNGLGAALTNRATEFYNIAYTTGIYVYQVACQTPTVYRRNLGSFPPQLFSLDQMFCCHGHTTHSTAKTCNPCGGCLCGVYPRVARYPYRADPSMFISSHLIPCAVP